MSSLEPLRLTFTVAAPIKLLFATNEYVCGKLGASACNSMTSVNPRTVTEKSRIGMQSPRESDIKFLLDYSLTLCRAPAERIARSGRRIRSGRPRTLFPKGGWADA